MSTFITERDPVKFHSEKPNFRGKSPEYYAAFVKVESTYKEYLKVCDEIEEKSLDISKRELDKLVIKAFEKLVEFTMAENFKGELYEKENK
jgi:hypothetical protein